jgi:hypothetical protein
VSLLGFTASGSTLSLRNTVRVGRHLSILGFSCVGSSFSLRSAVRSHSGLSLLSMVALNSALRISVIDQFIIGSTCSVRGNFKFGSSFSVLASVSMASGLSIRSFSTINSKFSVQTKLVVDEMPVSVYDYFALGSSYSLRSHCAFGNRGIGISILDKIEFGSMLSIRPFFINHKKLNVKKPTQLGGVVSVLQNVECSSAISLRSHGLLSRIGTSVFAQTHLGSTFSLRGFSRVGSNVSTIGIIHMASVWTMSVIN